MSSSTRHFHKLRPNICAANVSRVDQATNPPFQHTFIDRSNEIGQDEKASETMDTDAPIKPLALISADSAKSLDMESRWAKRAKKSRRANVRKVSGECCATDYSEFL